jgi:hypothetical protein
VVAEKFEALMSLGIANSRMKDLHDVQTLSREFPFGGSLLAEALANTFKRRGTNRPHGRPLVLTAEFFGNEDKKKQWAAFCERNKSYVEESPLQHVCKEIEAFLALVLEGLAGNKKFVLKWRRDTGWR